MQEAEIRLTTSSYLFIPKMTDTGLEQEHVTGACVVIR